MSLDDRYTDDDNVSVTYMEKEEVCHGNYKDLFALGASSLGFVLFGLLELIYSIVSHSLCLLVDSMVALTDGCIYIMSFSIEMYKSCNPNAKFSFQFLLFTEVYFPLFFTFVLIGFMINSLFKSIPVLLYPDDKSDVDVSYIFVFGSINLSVDLICAGFHFPELFGIPSYKKVKIESCYQKVKMEKNIATPAATPLIEQENPISMEVEDKNFIMVSALIHLFADTLSAMLEIVAACLVYFGKFNSNICDASAAIASAIIVTGICIYFMIELWYNYNRLQSRKKKLLSPDEVSCLS